MSWMYQRDEVEITVNPTEESKPDIDQYSITVPRLEKEEAMLRILRSGALERVIVFCNTKVMCQRLSDDLRRAGIHACLFCPEPRETAADCRIRDFTELDALVGSGLEIIGGVLPSYLRRQHSCG